MKRMIQAAAAAAMVLSVAITPAVAQTSGSHAGKKIFKIGLVLDVGGVNDKSFNHLAYSGLLTSIKKYGVRGTYIPSSEQSQYVPNLQHFAGHVDLVIATGGLMSQAIYQVAKQYPRQKFAIIDGAPADAQFNTHILRNVEDLIFREQQSGFLAGVIAGLMEKNHVGKATHNTIGYMGGIAVPPVVRYEAGYVFGAKMVDHSIKVLGSYSQSFTDESKGNAIGRQQISQGADILFQVAGASGLGYLAAAQQAGKYGIGVDADQHYLGRYIITSAIKHVDIAVIHAVRDVVQHHFRYGNRVFNIQNHGTGFATPSSIVPAYIVKRALHFEQLLKQSKILPPTTVPQS